MTAERTDEAHEAFGQIRPELEAASATDLNESDVRLRIIDRMLLEVLGWERESIQTEVSSLEGYLDYLLLGDNGRGRMVVEAKRTGLLQPDTSNAKRAVLSLKGAVLKPLDAAAKQAIAY
ncbi:MAG: ATP-binding protein, partial [Pseudomonadota bacterium]